MELWNEFPGRYKHPDRAISDGASTDISFYFRDEVEQQRRRVGGIESDSACAAAARVKLPRARWVKATERWITLGLKPVERVSQHLFFVERSGNAGNKRCSWACFDVPTFLRSFHTSTIVSEKTVPFCASAST